MWANHTVRTDLAMERTDMLRQQSGGSILNGIQQTTEKGKGWRVHRITIENEEGAQQLGKPMGQYVTIECPGLRQPHQTLQKEVINAVTQELRAMLKETKISDDAPLLIVGLGNVQVTPDSLGPRIAEQIWVTRHLEDYNQAESGRYRSVSAVAPGVLGVTGIETGEMVQGIVQKTSPAAVLAIDALASQSLERVHTTIQLANNGIHPGSGIGHRRIGLTSESLGVPVIAMGVPTVVYASTIANEAIEQVLRRMSQQETGGDLVTAKLQNQDAAEREKWIKEMLAPLGNDMLVTPKDTDSLMEETSMIIATAINRALHIAVDEQNAAVYTH